MMPEHNHELRHVHAWIRHHKVVELRSVSIVIAVSNSGEQIASGKQLTLVKFYWYVFILIGSFKIMSGFRMAFSLFSACFVLPNQLLGTTKKGNKHCQ